MTEKPNYYSIIPADVRYDDRLKDKAKLLYSEITALTNKDGYCYASNKYFADLYKVSTTTISLLIKNLIDLGYIESEIIYKEGTKEILNRYLRIIKDPYLRKLKYPYLKNLKYPIKENLKDNNTSINITSNNNIYIVQVIDYLNEKLGTRYSKSSSKTKTLITARINEGFTVEDFITVIDKKYQEWHNTTMEQYLRPETLFGTKFESYLNQKIILKEKTQKEKDDEFIKMMMEKYKDE